MHSIFAAVTVRTGGKAGPVPGVRLSRSGTVGPRARPRAMHALRLVDRPLAVLCAILVATNLVGPTITLAGPADAGLCHGASEAAPLPDGDALPWVKHCCFAAALALAPPAAPSSLLRASCAEGLLPAFIERPRPAPAPAATRIRAPPV